MSQAFPESDDHPGAALPVSRAMLGRGMAALRIFVGVIFFANGVAKLTGERNIDIG